MKILKYWTAEEFKLHHQMKSIKNKNIFNIILDDDLKNHLWEVFEKPFAKDKKYL
jgi:hypothetical protein